MVTLVQPNYLAINNAFPSFLLFLLPSSSSSSSSSTPTYLLIMENKGLFLAQLRDLRELIVENNNRARQELRDLIIMTDNRARQELREEMSVLRQRLDTLAEKVHALGADAREYRADPVIKDLRRMFRKKSIQLDCKHKQSK